MINSVAILQGVSRKIQEIEFDEDREILKFCFKHGEKELNCLIPAELVLSMSNRLGIEGAQESILNTIEAYIEATPYEENGEFLFLR